MKENESPADSIQPDSGFVLAGHFRENDSYSTSRPAGMKDWLIAYTIDGEGYFEVPNERHACKSHDIVILRTGTPHRYGTAEGGHWHFFWAHFDDAMIPRQWLPDSPLFLLSIDNESVRKRIHRAFMKILSDSRERGDYWNELCVQSLTEMMILLTRRRQSRMDGRVEETLHLLSRQMREPVRIERIARAVGLSPSRLSHLFKENTGLSIVDTVNRMRIRQAALLLEHTERGSSEIAFDVGFHNYNHFINQFHKWQGMSPTSYRKSKRGR
ncbi:helix-turn-helix domain-containing protein [Paenibacillus soyae]|uniref:Helix-turn-helix domain-containing protein n=1 Tax=Paenibacillus soyae TaxID=2969249 RepID=A0A9X2MRP9_9BACL|nr:helix-turn-helix domain-containing protein [Paenibacillus soyae]MCR2802737.1 helix-turn-helix domain-containing protein [Paenibacillus soyae]